MDRLRRAAWLLIVVADAGILLWGAMAALVPERLLGPGGVPILTAGYEGFSGGSWAELGPDARGFMEVLFRVYGSFNVAFGLVVIAVAATSFRRGDKWAWWALLVGNTIAFGAAMTYDWTVNAIGPFELLEYLGLALIYAALVVHAPFRAGTAYATGVEAPLRDATARQHGDVHQAGGVGSGVVVPLQGSSSQHQRNVE